MPIDAPGLVLRRKGGRGGAAEIQEVPQPVVGSGAPHHRGGGRGEEDRHEGPGLGGVEGRGGGCDLTGVNTLAASLHLPQGQAVGPRPHQARLGQPDCQAASRERQHSEGQQSTVRDLADASSYARRTQLKPCKMCLSLCLYGRRAPIPR